MSADKTIMSTPDRQNGIGSQAASRLGGTANTNHTDTPQLQSIMQIQVSPTAFLNPNSFVVPVQPKKRLRSNNGNKKKFNYNTESELDSENSEIDDSTNTQTGKYSNSNRIMQLERDQKILKAENALLKSDLEKLKQALDKLTKKINHNPSPQANISPATVQPVLFSSVVTKNATNARPAPSQAEINVLNAYTKERHDQESRERNVLIMGVRDVTDDTAKTTVDQIFTALHIDPSKIVSVFRFPKPPNGIHPPIIKVCLTNKEDRLSVLKASKLLRQNTTFVKVYINSDLTIAQRNEEKRLIAERNYLNEQRLKSQNPDDKKYYYGIRNCVVKRIPCSPVQ